MTERQVQLISDFKPDIIMVTPSYMLAILDEFARSRASIREVVAADRHLRRRALDQRDARARSRTPSICDAVDIYGLSEVMGPGVASECVETKDGLTSGKIISIPEVIDPVTGAVLPDGEKGELVFTSLTKGRMPVIRYRTRDLTRLLPGTARSHAPDGERSPAAPTT